VDFSQRTYPVRITLRGTRTALPQGRPTDRDCPCTQNYGGTLFASARKVSFLGLHVAACIRTSPSLLRQPDADPDGRGLAGHARRHLPARRRRPHAARRGDAEGDDGTRDEQGLRQTGEDGVHRAHPIVVTNSELSYCLDRGVKVQEDYLVLTDNWIHNNLRCALFAIVPNGKIDAVGNIIEENAMNCPSGAPPHCVGQDVTRPDGPQVSAQGNSTLFMLDRNIVRNGPFSGVFWQVGATGTLDNSFVCGMQFSGVLSERKAGKTAAASLRGSASVLNGRIGVEVRNNVGLDLGTADDLGHNAFAGNPDGAQVVNRPLERRRSARARQ
jgi:hypothetical protein